MRHDAPQSNPPLPSLRSELANYLSVSGSHLSMAEAAGLAVRAWIAADRAQASQPSQSSRSQSSQPSQASQPSQSSRSPELPQSLSSASGYLWKTLFLPHGTQIRMHHLGRAYLAEVQGDQIIYAGRAVSPRGMTLAITGAGRNAWRDLVLRLPGERHWKAASRLRHETMPATRHQPQPAPAALSSAALALADAFTSALALGAPPKADKLSPAAPVQHDRRVAKHQRQSDILQDYCDFD